MNLIVPADCRKSRSTASMKKVRNNYRYFKRIKNAAENIEFSAALLAFPQNKLYRTPVRRRICFAKISLPFSASARVPIIYRHSEPDSKTVRSFYLVKTETYNPINFDKFFKKPCVLAVFMA